MYRKYHWEKHKQDLRHLHLVQKLPISQIAKRYKVAPQTIVNALKALKITVPMTKAARKSPPKSVLEALYLKKKMSTTEIAEIFDMTTGGVCIALERHGIKRRPKSEAMKLVYGTAESSPGKKKKLRWVKVASKDVQNYKMFA